MHNSRHHYTVFWSCTVWSSAMNYPWWHLFHDCTVHTTINNTRYYYHACTCIPYYHELPQTSPSWLYIWARPTVTYHCDGHHHTILQNKLTHGNNIRNKWVIKLGMLHRQRHDCMQETEEKKERKKKSWIVGFVPPKKLRRHSISLKIFPRSWWPLSSA